jgi:hypothetical protein
MDKPTVPTGPNASPRPEESGSEQDFGATGVFQAVNIPEAVVEPLPGFGADPDVQGNRAPGGVTQQPMLGAKDLAEPVVHRVGLGGAAAMNSPELLDRIRMASAETSLNLEKAPAAGSGGKGSGGFTELLRTLEDDLPTPVVASKGKPAVETPRAAENSGFTSLLRTLSSPPPTAPSAEEPMRIGQPATGFIPEEPRKVPAASSPSGFTELLRATPGGDPVMSGSQMHPAGRAEVPVASTGGGVPAPFENKPGAFTQLFSSLGVAEANPTAPTASNLETGDSSRGSGGSFTRMLSLEPQSAPAEIPSYEESKPAAGNLNYGLTPGLGGAERPTAESRDPFSSQPFPEAQPIQSTPAASGVGITRLIQMLDEPSKAPASRREEMPASPQPGVGPGAWTQTFASLATPNDPPAPAAKTPDWAPKQTAPALSGYTPPPEVRPPSSLREPSMNPPAAPVGTSGPSEFTRILDASRIREQAMRGEQVPVADIPAPAPPPRSFAAAPPPMPIPSYPVSVSPPAIGMHGGGGMPRPVVYPPQMPQAPGMYVPTPTAPQPPGMYIPTPTMPPAPQAPPAKPGQPAAGAGGLQQLVPVLLVVVIVLLVVLIVTVIFLMKH